MTTPPDIEKLVKRARAANSNLGATCADALESISAQSAKDKERIAELERERDNARANSVSRGKMLIRLRDRLINTRNDLNDQGDLVAFGSTNDADQLRDAVDELEEFKWDMILREKDEDDLLSANQKANAHITELEAQIVKSEVQIAELLLQSQKNFKDADFYARAATGQRERAERVEAQIEAFREALEEAANIAVRVPAKHLGMDKDQRIYSWHDVMDSLKKAMNAIRSLKKG